MTNFVETIREKYDSTKPKFLEITMCLGAAAVIAGGLDAAIEGASSAGTEVAAIGITTVILTSGEKAHISMRNKAPADADTATAEVIELPHGEPTVPAPEAEIA